MNDNSTILPVLIIILFLIYTLRKFNLLKNLDWLFVSKKKKEGLYRFYQDKLNYFRILSEKDKNRFLKRAYKLVKINTIIGRQGFKVTPEVKLLVVAAQIQITFGLYNYILPKFKTIFIYPGSYKNPLTGNIHDGEINPRGLIVMSWEKLAGGYLNSSDSVNLGLHEMAHALMFTIIKTDSHDSGLDYYMGQIVKLSQHEIQKIRAKDSHLFREYAGQNPFEFFAIAIEHFFESPLEFKAELPAVYSYISKLLKQDPANKIFRL